MKQFLMPMVMTSVQLTVQIITLFAMIQNKEKQQIFTCEMIEPKNGLHFCLYIDLLLLTVYFLLMK